MDDVTKRSFACRGLKLERSTWDRVMTWLRLQGPARFSWLLSIRKLIPAYQSDFNSSLRDVLNVRSFLTFTEKKLKDRSIIVTSLPCKTNQTCPIRTRKIPLRSRTWPLFLSPVDNPVVLFKFCEHTGGWNNTDELRTNMATEQISLQLFLLK